MLLLIVALLPSQAGSRTAECQALRDFHVSYLELAGRFPAIAGLLGLALSKAQLSGEISSAGTKTVGEGIIGDLNASTDFALEEASSWRERIDGICPD
ncbi:hypothetical protein [Pseudooceanicola sp.]|uniref:hypothetical protein n=1 Tax=Pseudooceanicola sp. TaxID=1914328 RepID=UPI0035165378